MGAAFRRERRAVRRRLRFGGLMTTILRRLRECVIDLTPLLRRLRRL